MTGPIGILLSNLGTPDAPTVPAVRRYLAQFLTDSRVIDIPWLSRQILVRAIIAPFRAPRSARAYASIWCPKGSPLMVQSLALAQSLGETLGPEFRVALGMRYGRPSLESAFLDLLAQGCTEIRLVALYPQEAEATLGSTRAEFERVGQAHGNPVPTSTTDAFPEATGFVAAQADLLRLALEKVPAEGRRVLFSFHGLPERQVLRADISGSCCLRSPDCCQSLADGNSRCYRAQCHATSRALARALDLPAESFATTFQSRLGRIPWIGPHTDHAVRELAAGGTKHLVVATPSFVADCLETLEEVGIGLRRVFLEAGGETFALVPCVNTHPLWVQAVADLARGNS